MFVSPLQGDHPRWLQHHVHTSFWIKDTRVRNFSSLLTMMPIFIQLQLSWVFHVLAPSRQQIQIHVCLSHPRIKSHDCFTFSKVVLNKSIGCSAVNKESSNVIFRHLKVTISENLYSFHYCVQLMLLVQQTSIRTVLVSVNMVDSKGPMQGPHVQTGWLL